MKMPDRIESVMFAPCGMNCMVCYKHCKSKKPCEGCLLGDQGKPEHCGQCKIKACLKGKNMSYCFECETFPCKLIKNMEKSYQQRYQISLIEYSRQVKELGIEVFMEGQKESWSCPHCGGVVSLHEKVCSECKSVVKSCGIKMSNSNQYVDLHLHSYYSDGTMSPEEIVRTAVANNVGLLAITDHNVLTAAGELPKLCETYGIAYLCGVELDSIDQETDVHILGYGVDIEEESFARFVKRNREFMDDISVELVAAMESDYANISLADFQAYTYDRGKGGWKALHYFREKGLTKSLREGFTIYNQYGITNDSGDYPPLREVLEQIHSAGGKAILAHPGVTIKETEPVAFGRRLIELLEMGFDGVECYYPTHTEEITDLCLSICRARKLLITTGSDCHGGFGYSEIGELGITLDMLELGELIK